MSRPLLPKANRGRISSLLNERRFRDAMEHSPVGTALVSLDGRWLFTNAAIRDLLGYDHLELEQTTFQKLTHPEDLDADLEKVGQLLAGEIRGYQMEKRYIRKDGSTVWSTLSVALVRDRGGDPQYFISHVQDISARKAADAERERLSLQANAANAAKSDFLANMSHEIRTPLNGVLGMAQAMAADALSEAQQARLAVIRESGNSLLCILNDILDLSKIEAGKLELESVEFDLSDLLESTLRSFAPAAQDKALGLTLDIGDAAGVYRGDPTRVRQVLSNLISNAIKFTARGDVRVAAQARPVGFELIVADTGAGISAASIDRIFSKFMQADASTTRQHGGTGLGLSICRELVELMGGQIAVTSELGVGSTFRASFGLERLAEALAPRDKAPPQLGFGGARPRVLVAEDNAVNQLVIRTLLAQADVEAVVVPNGSQALETWRQTEFAAVLMDVQMPVMDGIGATRAIRAVEAVEQRRPTPIIGLTANVMPHQTASYLAAGMNACVAKPIEIQALLETLAAVLDAAGETGPAAANAGR